jgi:hypothetical protein
MSFDKPISLIAIARAGVIARTGLRRCAINGAILMARKPVEIQKAAVVSGTPVIWKLWTAVGSDGSIASLMFTPSRKE